MKDCECLQGCPFFNDKMDSKPALADIFKKRYCKGDNTHCARYMVFKKLGKGSVPSNLFPNMTEVAEEIIARGHA